jgi:hypothetical protein
LKVCELFFYRAGPGLVAAIPDMAAKHMKISALFATIIVFASVFALSLSAAPKLAVDAAEYRAGSIDEEKVVFLKHTFTLKNEGDSVLEIIKIKPSCGCTSTESDSIIPPRGTGHITMILDLREVRDVDFYKYIIVRTNDPGWPRLELALSGTIKFLINFEPEAIVLPSMDKKDTVQEVTLQTAKSDLRVTAVSFVLSDPPLEWLASLPLRFSFDENGVKGAGDEYTYKLKIFYAPVQGKFAGYGKFIVWTNHPDKPELKISGALDVKKTP